MLCMLVHWIIEIHIFLRFHFDTNIYECQDLIVATQQFNTLTNIQMWRERMKTNEAKYHHKNIYSCISIDIDSKKNVASNCCGEWWYRPPILALSTVADPSDVSALVRSFRSILIDKLATFMSH